MGARALPALGLSLSESSDWRSAVRVDEAAGLARELIDRATDPARARAVSVTDLLDLRPAFYRTRVSVPVPAERRMKQEEGRELHSLLGIVLGAPRYREVRVRRSGIVGQIDFLESEPTEIKTTGRLPSADGLERTRPAYLEQLAMYCALVERPRGQLILVESGTREEPKCSAFRATYASLASISARMLERADALRVALDAGAPRDLSMCPWFGRGCEFQAAGVCNCDGSEPRGAALLHDGLEELRPRAELSRELTDRLHAVMAGSDRPVVRRFRDLLYPRRVYFERRFPLPAGTSEPTAGSPDRRDLYRTLLDIMEGGPSGEVTREPVPTGEPPESVACFRGSPFLLKVSRVRAPHTAAKLPLEQPQYLLELGLRCASLARDSGWLIVGYQLAENWEGRLRAFEVRFERLDQLADLAYQRAELLSRALRDQTPGQLAPCPGWMYPRCPYRARCGCGEDRTN